MDVILPVGLYNYQEIIRCAFQLNFDEFASLKLSFLTNYCDLDVYETLGDERIQLLLYAWEVCTIHLCNADSEIPPALIPIVKLLAHHTLHLWLSQEWRNCHHTLKEELLIYLDQAQYIFSQIQTLSIIDWPYLLSFGVNPWSLPYLQHIGLKLKINEEIEIEHVVATASVEDIEYLQKEGVMVIVLRLINLFNASSWDYVKQLALRVLAAWLATTHIRSKELGEHEKRCLILMGHIYLMTIYVADDNRGYIIDNLMHNIRFYYHNIQLDTKTISAVEYTPARLIAMVCYHLDVDKNQFFEHFVFNAFDLSLNKLFGVVSQAYMSYVLGNMLMELMAMNEEDFNKNLQLFKKIINRYVDEREKSEKYLLNETKKKTAQKTSWARPNTVDMRLDYKNLICKGNRASNFGNYNYDDDGIKLIDAEQLFDEERDRRIDPIFQNIPNNELVLSYVYDILAKRGYSGWHFAKVILLLKIIGHKMNKIETWRYHSGLSTEFMLNLEKQLSAHYADLAKIFNDYHFIEQELWLTAFYLCPSSEFYAEVKRCGIRFNRRRNITVDDDARDVSTISRTDRQDNAKFGLLSSTIHVNQILNITNPEAPNSDYEPISKALLGLRLPERVLKDLLTVTFFARNKSFAWALDWTDLRDCCRDFIKKSKIKKRFVELNMSEANDRLKFLEIDYEKYKHRPQLDYGTIEEGYENVACSGDTEDPDSHINDDCDDLEFDCGATLKRIRQCRRKFWDEESVSDKSGEESDGSEAYYSGTRRTRARTAAVIATTMFKDETSRRSQKERRGVLRFSSDSESPSCSPRLDSPSQSKNCLSESLCIQSKFKLTEALQSRVKYKNTTNGFEVVTDIWSFEKDELESVAIEANILMESKAMLGQLISIKHVKETLHKEHIEMEAKDIKCFRTKKHQLMNEQYTNAAIEFHEVQNSSLMNKSTNNDNANKEMYRKFLNDSDSSLRSDTSTQAHKDLDESVDDGTSDDPRDYTNDDQQGFSDLLTQNSREIHEFQAYDDQKTINEVITLETVCKLIEETIPDNTLACSIVPDFSIEKPEVLHQFQETQGISSMVYKEQTTVPLNEGLQTINKVDEVNLNRLNRNKEFISRHLTVRLRRLRADEISQLRQPRVRIRRLNLDDISQLQASSSRNQRNNYGRRSAYLYGLTDDGNGSGSGSSSSSYGAPRLTRRSRQIKKRVHGESSTDAEDNILRSSNNSIVRRRIQRQLIAMPRSASGLKMRISSLQRPQKIREATDNMDAVECIQISTSSSSSPSCGEGVSFPLSPVPEAMSIDIMDDPLYEEEVVPFR